MGVSNISLKNGVSMYPVSNHCCNLTVFFSPVPPFSPEIMGVMSGEIGSVVKGENIYFILV